MMAVQCLTIDPIDTTDDDVVLVSSSSDPHIRHWRISLASAIQIADEGISTPQITNRQHETSVYKLLFDLDGGDLWTASADGTAKRLSRARSWEAQETYTHGDYVRAVALTDEWIITAGRDENVKVWEKATGQLFFVYEGHFQEVTGLVVMNGGKEVISISIDGTLRTWPLDRKELEKPAQKKTEESQSVIKEAPLTLEEEAELAELMGDGE
jgi:WD40 repeat protein